MTTRRRRFLRLCGIVGIGTLAGCPDSSEDEETPPFTETTDGGPQQTTRTAEDGTPTPTETDADGTRQSTQTADDETPTHTGTSDGGAQQVKLTADDGDSEDFFGSSVAVSNDGSTALVGASSDEDPNGERAGSAYVFETNDGSWTQRAKLTADDGDGGDGFGGALAVSDDGTIALVGTASDVLPNDEQTQSAYVFEVTDGSWTQQAKLTADDTDGTDDGDGFGRSVAISGDGTTALVGAPSDEDPNGENSGSAYVFDAGDGSWTQRAKLTADDGDSRDFFGASVGVSSDGATAIVGASRDEDPNGNSAGSAYVFEDSGGSWNQQAGLTADDGDGRDYFGVSVATSNAGSTVLVGAYSDEDPNGERAGSAYVFDAGGGSWTQQAKLAAADGDAGDWFGWSVDLSGDGTTVLVGAFRDDVRDAETAGSTYLFDAGDGSWTQRARLTAPDGDGGDWFGRSVALSSAGDTALVGALRDADPNGQKAGSAYVFTP